MPAPGSISPENATAGVAEAGEAAGEGEREGPAVPVLPVAAVAGGSVAQPASATRPVTTMPAIRRDLTPEAW